MTTPSHFYSQPSVVSANHQRGEFFAVPSAVTGLSPLGTATIFKRRYGDRSEIPLNPILRSVGPELVMPFRRSKAGYEGTTGSF